MTAFAEAGLIVDGGIRFSAHTADNTVEGLGHAVDFALDHTGKAGLDMTIQAVHLLMRGGLPTGIIGFHDMAGIAKAGLTGDDHKTAGGKNEKQKNQKDNLFSAEFPPFLFSRFFFFHSLTHNQISSRYLLNTLKRVGYVSCR